MVKHLKSWQESNVILGIEEFKILWREYRAVLEYNEPFPMLENISPYSWGRLESTLGAVNYRDGYGGYRYTPGTVATAAYLCFVNKGHCLDNGNKRASLLSAIAYLTLNNMFIEVEWKGLYDLAKLIANSSRSIEEEIPIVAKIIDPYIVPYDESLKRSLIASAMVWYVRSMETGGW